MARRRFEEVQQARLSVIAPYLQPGEVPHRAGLARWEELEARGAHGGEGFLVATDRRLIYFNPRTGVTSIPYGTITDQRVDRHVITAHLVIGTTWSGEARFNGAKNFMAEVEAAITDNARIPKPPVEGTKLGFSSGDLYPVCLECRHDIPSVKWGYCPGCARTIDWEASRAGCREVPARAGRPKCQA